MDTRTNSNAGAVTNGALVLLALATGAGLAYFADPDRGERRRANLRKRTVSALESGEDAIDRLRSDIRQRTRGIAEKTKSLVASEDRSDSLLVDRVRTHVSNLVDDAREIAVIARGGVVELIGRILYEERNRLLAAVRSVPGVREVVDRLQDYFADGRGARRPSAPQLLAGSLGTALLALGLAKRGRAIPAAFIGASLLAQSMAQSPPRRLLGR